MDNRVVRLNKVETPKRGDRVVYIMSRDQRVNYNHALLWAAKLAHELENELEVVFCLNPNIKNGNLRSYLFMLEGLKDVEKSLSNLGISFTLLKGNPEKELSKYLSIGQVSSVVTDFSPLRYARKWREGIANTLGEVGVPFYEVDTHNIVPVRFISSKQEYSAYTLRLKINRVLEEFLNKAGEIASFKFKKSSSKRTDWVEIEELIREKVDPSVLPSEYYIGGIDNAYKTLKMFIESKLASYPENRNDPSLDTLSNLSPYLHFGNISSLEVVLAVKASGLEDEVIASFIEEIVIRKELSDNFCYYNKQYDNPSCYPKWARESLDLHMKDKREYLYSQKEFEQGRTHDDLWNAGQMEMVKTGKMHGYMRMYWAKKVLEWSKDYNEAHKILVYLNDKYSIDGRDPNGYVGIAWSLGGVHDRPWFERDIFGKVRYMNLNGMKRKFDVQKYIEKVSMIV